MNAVSLGRSRATAVQAGLKQPPAANGHSSPLALLLRHIACSGYHFTTITPLTHERFLRQRGRQSGTTLRDIFGWNMRFAASAITPMLLALMKQAGVLVASEGLWRSSVRISSIGHDLFLHSAYPTNDTSAVFFGPDTCRFVHFLQEAMLASRSRLCSAVPIQPLRILDVGCGSGAGGILLARELASWGVPSTLVMSDINPLALYYTAINAEIAGIPVVLAQGDALAAVQGDFDLIISNPPYLDDALQRDYRHGGTQMGMALSLRIATEALLRLAPGGRLLLYTGVAIVDGADPLLAALEPLLSAANCHWSYREIDPDVFGEELTRPVYAQADRIAVTGLIARRREAPA